MKNIVHLFLLVVCLYPCTILSQQLPELPLRNTASKDLLLPEIQLAQGEIAVIITTGGGRSAYDSSVYYVFKHRDNVKAYEQKIPKRNPKNKNLKKTSGRKVLGETVPKRLHSSLIDKRTAGFLKYSQADFTLKLKDPKKNNPCIIDDAQSYTITFVQNGKANSYTYYAPKYHLEQCKNPAINKKVLADFVKLLELWEVEL